MSQESAAVCIVEIPPEYASLYWKYCLKCKNPMFGMERELPEKCEFTHKCVICGAINVFRDSPQPVTLKLPDSRALLPSTRIPGTRQKTVS